MSNVATTLGVAGKSPVFLFCDHAKNFVPDELQNLGLSAAHLADHISYDPGSAALTTALADVMDARALLCGFSRLMCDPNRGEERDDLILTKSDTVPIPGNQNLSKMQVAQRLEHFHQPYHQQLAAEVETLSKAHADPFVISIHSFCRQNRTEIASRPWQVGVLWRQDPASAKAMMSSLQAQDIVVGDNEPYSAKLYNYSIDRHIGPRNIRHITLEIRQDLLAAPDGITRWRDILLTPLRALAGG